MDADRFDTLARSLRRSPSRRTVLRLLATPAIGGLSGGLLEQRTAAHDLSKTCKKKSGKAKKKCLKKAKKHQAQHEPMSAPPPQSPIAVLTYECPGPEESSTSSFSTTREAQSFTAVRSGPLHQIRFGISKQAGSTGDYVVELLDLGVDGKPTNTVLATTTVSDASVPAGDSTLTAGFAGPSLVAGVEYAAALSRLGADPFTSHTINMRVGDECTGRAFGQDPRGTGEFDPFDQTFDLIVAVTVLV